MALQHVTGSSNQFVSLASGDDAQVSTSTFPQNEPSVAVNPSNPQHLVAGANDQLLTRNWLAVYTSSDSGLTWTNGLIPMTGTLGSFQDASDPAVSFSENGTLYYSGVAFNVAVRSNTAVAVDGTVFVSKSTDNGSSFPLTTIVASGSNRIGGIFNDKPYVGVDETTGLFAGRVYVSWTRFTSSTTSDIMVAYSGNGRIAKVMVSADGGTTWAQAALQEPVMSKSFTRFRIPRGLIYCRAAGAAQLLG